MFGLCLFWHHQRKEEEENLVLWSFETTRREREIELSCKFAQSKEDEEHACCQTANTEENVEVMWEMKLNKKVFASASKWNCSWRLQFCLCSEVVASPVSSWNSCLNSSLPQFWVWFQKRCLDLHIPLSCNLKSLSLSRIEILYCSVFLVSSSVLLFCTTSLCTTNGFFLSFFCNFAEKSERKSQRRKFQLSL